MSYSFAQTQGGCQVTQRGGLRGCVSRAALALALTLGCTRSTSKEQPSQEQVAVFNAHKLENGGWVIDCSSSSVRCVTNFDGGSAVLVACPAGEVCKGSKDNQR